ncbi:MAG: hypothetical protein CM1200mP2_11220 [Planctomycetaceae bacterium]|nr:MAG: hypothetical protein CM1200mP2_11220 [Planctomycetaceae bacterium]
MRPWARAAWLRSASPMGGLPGYWRLSGRARLTGGGFDSHAM